jgi:hypothetical protein
MAKPCQGQVMGLRVTVTALRAEALVTGEISAAAPVAEWESLEFPFGYQRVRAS